MGSGKAELLNLDTHIVLHLLGANLSKAEIDVLTGCELGVSAIVLWELAKLKQLGRIGFGPEDAVVSGFLRECRIWPIDAAIAVASTNLDIQSDPAGELIAATSVVNRVPLVTRDARLRSSKMIPLALP